MVTTNYLSGYAADFRQLYGQTDLRLLTLEGIAPQNLNVADVAYRFMHEQTCDMSIDANANRNDGKSYCSYLVELNKGWLKLQGYYDIYKKIKELFGQERAQYLLRSIWQGNLYLHDSTAVQVPYCYALSTAFLLEKGTTWGPLKSLPPQHCRAYIDQIKELTIEVAQNIAGAVAIGDLFVNYAYFVKKDQLDVHNVHDRKLIENDFQSLVHTLNKKLRPSHQSPFTNVSIFDRPNLEYLFADVRYPDGSSPDFEIISEVQKIFCNWFKKGDPISGVPYRFPVATLNIRIDENRQIIDRESLDYFTEINLEKACFNLYISSGNKVASCCRLVNDFDAAGLDSFGNGGISLGSHRVVTVNLARMGHEAKDVHQVFHLLHERLCEARDILIAHRALVQEYIDKKCLHLFRYDVMHLSRFFSTFGINGLYECMLELDLPITSDEGRKWAHAILDEIRQFALQCSRERGVFFNVEQVPAESLAVLFAEKDRLLFGMDYPLYANQFIPLWVETDIVDRIKLDGGFSRSLTGGGIVHLNIGERLTNVNQMKRLVEYAIECGCEHFAVNYNYCSCEQKHVTIAGPSEFCPICSSPIVEQYTRVVGMLTPVSTWNKIRRAEHKKRVFTRMEEQASV